MCVGVYIQATACIWKSEDNLRERVLSYHMDPRNQTYIIGLISKCLYLLSFIANLAIKMLGLKMRYPWAERKCNNDVYILQTFPQAGISMTFPF